MINTKNITIKGIVVKGQQLGRKLGFKTANLENINIDLFGVFITSVKYNDKQYYGISNCGYRPTVLNNHKYLIETHILDFDKDIYDEELEITFLDKIRDEQKFASLELLKEQLEKDKEYCIKYIDKYNL